MEYPEIENPGICPNCGSENYDVTKRICFDCGYRLDHNYPSLYPEIEEKENKIIENLTNLSKKYKFKFGNFEAYKIILENNKINLIKFKFQSKEGEKRFIVHIDYKIHQKHIHEVEYYETDPDEREKDFDIVKIENLRILSIAEKAHTGYKESKYNPNYFSYLGLNKQNLRTFIQNLLENFHSK